MGKWKIKGNKMKFYQIYQVCFDTDCQYFKQDEFNCPNLDNCLYSNIHLVNQNDKEGTNQNLNNKSHGRWLWYTKSENKIYYECYFRDDRQNGKAIGYFANGKIKYKGYFINDKKHGKQILYDKDGKIKSEEVWENGILKEIK